MNCWLRILLFCIFIVSAPGYGDELRGLNALVTGGSRGIGEACCYALAKEGANIALIVSRSIKEAESVVEKIKSYGVDACVYQCDVSNPQAVQIMVEEAHQRFGSLDILVNNAGIAHIKLAEDLTFEEWQRMIDVNLTGVFLCSQVVGRVMIEQGTGGSIINASLT